MDLLSDGLILLLLVLGVIVRWRIIIPARELLAEIQQLASGNYHPVIFKELPPFFKDASHNVRTLAETLAKQKAQLSEEEYGLSMILGRMTEGVVIVGPDLRIRLMNEAAMAMFNLQGNVVGLLIQEVFLNHELVGVAQNAVVTGEIGRGEFSIVVPGLREPRHLVVTAAPLKAPETSSPGGLLLVLHNITRIRELESVRREFVANVSHEFRTPLSIINGYLETLEDGKISKEMRHKSIAVMRRHCGRLNNLIEDLLTISKMEEAGVRLEIASTDVPSILNAVVEQMEGEIQSRGATLTLDIQEQLPALEIDAFRMEQAFSNLLANAIRHGRSEGGKIEVTARLHGLELMVSFRDNGTGIPIRDQEHIFERFYRVGGDRARHTGGTGLGLSIVKNVVQAHGGRIVLQSTPGSGSTFSIFLPVTRESALGTAD